MLQLDKKSAQDIFDWCSDKIPIDILDIVQNMIDNMNSTDRLTIKIN